LEVQASGNRGRRGTSGAGSRPGVGEGIRTPEPPAPARTATTTTIKTGGKVKPVNLPAWKRIDIDIDHIASGHMKGGSRVSPLKTLFPEYMTTAQVKKSVRQAYRYGKRVESQGERVLVRGQYAHLNIEMWVNLRTKTIESAYPL
jgi:hypothetical protein